MAITLISYFFETFFTHTRGVENTFWVLDFSHVAIDKEHVTFVSVVLLGDESVDFTDQVEIACFFNSVFAKKSLFLAGIITSAGLLSQVLEI